MKQLFGIGPFQACNVQQDGIVDFTFIITKEHNAPHILIKALVDSERTTVRESGGVGGFTNTGDQHYYFFASFHS